MRFFVLSVLFFSLLSISVSADRSTALESDCVTICSTPDSNGEYDFNAAYDCFLKYRNKADAYLATATCAWNIGQDSAAEEYAVKAGEEKEKWVRFVRPFARDKIKTGGTGEVWTLAYVASHGARHEDKAKDYLETSGQCIKNSQKKACAQMYFNNTVNMYMDRNIQSARSTDMSKYRIYGRVTDADGKPVKYAKVTVRCGRDYDRRTDANGMYQVRFNNTLSADQLCQEVRVYVKLQYHNPADDKVIYVVEFRHDPVWLMKKFKPRSMADLRQDINFGYGLKNTEYFSNIKLKLIPHMGVVHRHMAEAVEFFTKELGADIDYKLPVQVKTGYKHAWGTHYNPNSGTIVISGMDAHINTSNRPKNREHHEFAHHVMFSEYRKWPKESPAVIRAYGPRKNHDGYINPSTADSFMEGFAEFWPLVIADKLAEPRPDVYASWGTLERNIVAWGDKGRDEELAVAAVLWDLYDSANDEKMDLNEDEIWDIIGEYHRDFTSVYKAFKDKYKDEDVNKIFIDHGFFLDKTEGNKAYHDTEAFRDSNNNGRLDVGENWTDYSQHVGIVWPWMFYKEGDKVGSAANYWRQSRRNTVKTPGHFIKTDTNWHHFRVRVEFPDNPELDYEIVADNIDGKIFFLVPDWTSDAEITVRPEGSQGNALEFTAEEFAEAYGESVEQGYFVEHDFGVPDVDADNPFDEEDPEESTPYWESIDLEASDEDYEYVAPEEEDLPLEPGASMTDRMLSGDMKKGTSLLAWIIPIVVVLVILALLSAKKRTKNKTLKKRDKKH